MKKFLALLLMALLLIPALAMAADPSVPYPMNDEPPTDRPPEKIDIKTIAQKSSKYRLRMFTNEEDLQEQGRTNLYLENTPKYKADYSMSGAITRFTKFFDCGCSVSFASDGTIIEDGVIHTVKDGTKTTSYGWLDGKWHLNSPYGPETNLPASEPSFCIHFDPDKHKAGVSLAPVDGKRPPMTALEAANKWSNYVFSDINEIKQLAADITKYSITIESSTSSQCEFKKQPDTGILGFFYKGKLVEWYIGALMGNVYNGNTKLWYTGDDTIGSTTEGSYNWNTGELDFYKFWTADQSMVATYSGKNVLLSYELWAQNGDYWSFDGTNWYTCPVGEDDERLTQPTTEVLEKILHAPEPATYESQCVTSAQANSSSFDSEGVPYIVASGMDNVTPTITATQLDTDKRATEFNIELTQNGAEVQPAVPVSLTLAYPAGMSQDIVNKGGYEMVVVHVDDNGNREVMSTVAGNVKLTENGPQVTATSFSPYTVIWGSKDEITAKYPASVPGNGTGSVPQTGDTSNLALYAVLLTLSVGALAVVLVMGKRRANR